MKNLLMSLALILVTVNASASSVDTAYAIKNFKSALALKIGHLSKSQELKLTVVKTDEPVCGSAGLSLIATLQIKRTEKTLNKQTGQIVYLTVYEGIKSYAVSLAEAEQLTAKELAGSMMADDECSE